MKNQFAKVLNQYFDYPLEQGLRQIRHHTNMTKDVYFDYPLEQGLRHGTFSPFNHASSKVF